MPAPVTIRPFQPADQEATRDLVLAGLGEHFGCIKPELNPDLDDIWRSFPAGGGCFLVAEAEGRIVGSGGLLPEGPATWRIVRVSVAPHFRRAGLGRRLTRYLISAARELGARDIVVETNEDWQAAIALYLGCGFVVEAYRDGECHMRLRLST